MDNIINNVIKRDGRTVKLEKSKIIKAVNSAMLRAENGKLEDAEKVATKVYSKISKNNSITAEDIGDTVEATLIEMGFAQAAKEYIVYRHEARKVRAEKCNILNKKQLDEVDKALDTNSLRVLASRYLLRDENGNINETPKQLFERVAVLVGLGDVIHDERIFQATPSQPGNVLFGEWHEEAYSYLEKLDNFDGKFSIGKYVLNKYHFEALIRAYVDICGKFQAKSGFKGLLKLIASGHLDKYENNITEYFNLMVNRDFLPNTPTLMNAGAKLGQLSACFVLGMEDDISKIMKTSSDAAVIFKSGGGVGINYSDLRPEGDIVASTSGVASGPVSFMQIINTVTDVIKQGGKRRGANMGIIEAWHPDIQKFIEAKTKPGVLENFNVSVGIWADFWQALVNEKGNHSYNLKNPKTGNVVKQIDAKNLMDVIALSAWKSAEPGVIFFDNINKYNPLLKARNGPLRATNPCGEQSLYPYESCNLGSINLANFVDSKKGFDTARFEKIVRVCTRFLDNVIDMNKYPIPEIDKASKETRRIGLGIMGIADTLYALGITYNSAKGYDLMDRIAEQLSYVSMDESVKLAEERGSFDLFTQSSYTKGEIPVAGAYENHAQTYDWNGLMATIQKKGIRNSWTSTIAPTGTLSMLADVSNGVEPAFALVFEKRVTVGRFFYTNKIFEKALKDRGIYSDELLEKIANNYGSVQGIAEVPDDIKKVFVTAMDIHWLDHILAQSVWQKWISNAIAKTINMPGDVTAEDVKGAYLLAHEVGLKGVTVFRDGSRHEQVLHITGKNKVEKASTVVPSKVVIKLIDNLQDNVVKGYIKGLLEGVKYKEREIPEGQKFDKVIQAVPEPQGNKCPTCSSDLITSEGCHMCISCGFSACSSG